MADPTTELDNELDISDEDFAKLPIPGETISEPAIEEAIADPIIEPSITEETEEEIETAKPDVEPVVEKTEEPVAETTSPATMDYQAEYNKLTAPFKANGSEMQIKNTDDALKLMKMGANYHKKMAGLKPSLKTLKLLEHNGLLDPEKLNFLIDIHNRNPEAITKLIKDSKIDPLDINVTAESKYKPTHRNVSDTELDLDSILEDIQDTPSYTRTLNVVTKDWDEASRTAVATAPHIISLINGHIASGIYDKVMGAANYERSLGNLKGISDFDAYKQLGDILHARGDLTLGADGKLLSAPVKSELPAADKMLVRQTSNLKEADRIKNKKAAGPVKTIKTPARQNYNPLALSDEEFDKFDVKQFQT